MGERRKVIVYIAESLDGFIAKEDDDISWLSMVDRPGEDYGYNEFIDTIDTVIIGRKTYEKVLTLGGEFPHKDKKCYVLSKTMKGTDQNIEYYNGDICKLIGRLRDQSGKDIFIDGGAEVIKAFRNKNLIDQYIISIIPMLIGKGIRLFKDADIESRLQLIHSKVFESGLVQLRYERLE